MRYQLLFCLVFSCYLQTINAQGVRLLNGTVKDANTGSPLQGAYISFPGKNLNAITGGTGAFSLVIPSSLTISDTIVINALGYERQVYPLVANTQDIQVYLKPAEHILPGVTVASYKVDWTDFIAKFVRSFRSAELPFESTIHKTVQVSVNGKSTEKLKATGLAHNEGFTLSALKSYLRGLTIWYALTGFTTPDTALFIDANENGIPQAFTDLQRGKFQWLITTDTTGWSDNAAIANYTLQEITLFDGDSVYVVKHRPKSELTNPKVKMLNEWSSRNLYQFFSAEKTYYLRKSDHRLLRIDFYQPAGTFTDAMRTKIKTIDHISGSIGFWHFDKTPHPAYIYEQISYTDIHNNLIERNDSIFFSNIMMEKLSDDALKKRFQSKRLYRSYPIRDIELPIEPAVGAFRWVPVLHPPF
jgi:hypothetical protein